MELGRTVATLVHQIASDGRLPIFHARRDLGKEHVTFLEWRESLFNVSQWSRLGPKRIIVSQEVIRNADHKSSCVLSRDERRLAFVTRDGEGYRLAVRNLFNPGPDYSLQTASGISALAWSPDDKRIIFLATGTGLFWVCEPVSGRMIPLPIPKVDANTIAGLAWWKDEEVVVTFKRGETQMLYLATLKLMPVGEKAAWTKLGEVERKEALRKQSLNASGKVGYEVQFDGPKTVLAAQDVETAYARVLTADLGKKGDAFATRDGSILFLLEEEHLRVLYMGLRDAPTLRFVGEATEAFPTGTTVSEALAKRAIRAVVAAPIVNPLNGKTVAGDASRIKGYARLISANDKSSTVWIEQEHEPIREGDVLIVLSAIQGADELSVSRDWWAILTKADTNQSIPRRADVPSLLPSTTRVLLPLPEPPPKSLAPVPKTSQSTQQQSAPNATANLMAGGIPQLSPKATDEDKIRHFIKLHHTKTTRASLGSYSADFGAIVDTSRGESTSRAEVEQMRSNDIAAWDRITETVVEPIEVKRLTGNRFAVSYEMHFELNSSAKGNHSGDTLIDVDVLLTSQGQKIVKLRTVPMRNKKP